MLGSKLEQGFVSAEEALAKARCSPMSRPRYIAADESDGPWTQQAKGWTKVTTMRTDFDV